MKIIKKGKIIKQRIYFKDACESCGCIFEFTHEDIEAIERKPGGNVFYDCPYCGRRIKKRLNEVENRMVEEEYIPTIFKDEVKSEVDHEEN